MRRLKPLLQRLLERTLEFLDSYMRRTAVEAIAVGLASALRFFFEQFDVLSHVGEVGVGLPVADAWYLVVVQVRGGKCRYATTGQGVRRNPGGVIPLAMASRSGCSAKYGSVSVQSRLGI